MGGKGGSSGSTTIRFAAYLEAYHKAMLSHDGSHTLNLCVAEAMNATWENNPYANYVATSAEDGFLGAGYSISQFPSLFDMFGKFMAGLDIEVLWNQIYEESVRGAEIDAAVTSTSDLLDDELQTKILPNFLAGMRDLNAVHSSAFIVGKAIIYDAKTKSMADVISKLQMKMIDITQERWAKHLGWNSSVIAQYSDLIKLYYSAHFDAEAREMEFKVKDAMWDLSLFEQARAILAALNGAPAAQGRQEPSQASKSIAMAATGAGMGAQLGSSIASSSGGNYSGTGAAIGGVVGLAASFM